MMSDNAVNRIDGAAKAKGAVKYARDIRLPSMAYAALACSAMSSGRVADVDIAAAAALPGVIGILTHRNTPKLIPPEPGQLPYLLQDDIILYSGQPVAVVIADTPEHASEGARLISVHAAEGPAVNSMSDPDAQLFRPSTVLGEPTDLQRGDPARAFAHSEIQLQATYTTPMQHHQPIEPHAALADWRDGALTVHASVQAVQACRDVLARSFSLPADRVRVVSRFLGGGFGSKARAWWPCLLLAVMAARHCGRPVMLELNRQEMFRTVGCRAPSRHHIRIGASTDGTLKAIRHDIEAQGSAYGEFCDPHGSFTRMLYACPNLAITHRLVRVNGPHPTPMRPPGHGPASFALESAMDELAWHLGLDPLELRLRNYADVDPHTGLPWSSKALGECYSLAAQRFGWARRSAPPRSTRDGRLLVGWGMASATYPVYQQPAAARAQLRSDGSVVVQSATHDIGTGTYTVMAQVAADTLGTPLSNVTFELGDSALPLSPRAAGSMSAASVSPAVVAACSALRAQALAATCTDSNSPLNGLEPADIDVREGRLEWIRDRSRSDSYAALAARQPGVVLEAVGENLAGRQEPLVSSHAFGANFAEVTVDPDLGEVRVRRFVAAYGAGRILNLKMARSQQIGGIVLGIGMALGEASRTDPHLGRITTAQLTDYLLPTNADIPEIDVSFVDEQDTEVNKTGVKGIGMIGAVGVAAAIANAVFHATGRRIRQLPITPEVLASG